MRGAPALPGVEHGRTDLVLEIATRLPGVLPPSALDAGTALRDGSTDGSTGASADGAFAGLGDVTALEAPADVGLLVTADRLDPRLPTITVAFSGDTLIHSAQCAVRSRRGRHHARLPSDVRRGRTDHRRC